MNIKTKLSILSLTIFIGGCSTTGSDVISKNNAEIDKILGNKITNKNLVVLEQAKLPIWNSGDTITYSNGRDESVLSVIDDRILWNINDTTTFTTSNNFIEPEINYESTSKVMSKTVTSVNSSKHPDSAWPLNVGNSVNFYYDSVSTNLLTGKVSTNKVRNQECTVKSTATIEVLAGTFDTYVVKCDSINKGNKTGTQYTYYYAPSVGHYVMKISQKQTKTSKVELQSITRGLDWLNDNEKQYLKVILQSAMESNQKGQKTIWKSSDGNTTVEFYPTKTMQQESGLFCRNYVQTIKTETTSQAAGILCRVGEKKWEAPTL
jgi:surface antigen